MSNSTWRVLGSGGRAVAGLAYWTVGLVGICGYGLLLLTMVKHRKAFVEYTFYTIVWSLALADVGFLLVTFAVAVPLTFSADAYSSTSTVQVLAAGNTVSFFALLLTSFLLAFDRFSTFVLPTINQRVFSRPRVYATVAVPWLLGAAVLTATTVVGCPKSFDADSLKFTFACDGRDGKAAAVVLGVISPTTQLLPVVMAALYLALFVHLRKQKAGNAASQQNALRNKAERSLAIQGALICGTLWVETSSFWLAPRLTDSPVAPVVVVVIGIVNSTINPYIYFSFNGLVGQKLAATLGCQQQHASAVLTRAAGKMLGLAPNNTNQIAPALALELE